MKFWIALKAPAKPAGPLAWVSWIFNDVEHKAFQSTDWQSAQLEMPLKKLDQVRTLDRSAGEITFRSLDRLRLESNALVSIYRDRDPPSPNRKRIDDVVLEEGALLARLRSEDRQLRLQSPAAVVDLASTETRVQHSRQRDASTVAVYAGRARVRAQGESVRVDRGFGTRVKRGERPEVPTPLPAPPSWSDAEPIVAFQHQPPVLRWRSDNETSTAIVELTRATDENRRIIRRLAADGGTTRIDGLAPGVFEALLRTQDAKGIVGPQGPRRAIVVLPNPAEAEPQTEPVDVSAVQPAVSPGRATLRLSEPGSMTLEIPEGVALVSAQGRIDERRWIVALPESGRTVLPFELVANDDSWRASGELVVLVDAPPPPPPSPPAVPAAKPLRNSGVGLSGGLYITEDGDRGPLFFISYTAIIASKGLLKTHLGAEFGWTETFGEPDFESRSPDPSRTASRTRRARLALRTGPSLPWSGRRRAVGRRTAAVQHGHFALVRCHRAVLASVCRRGGPAERRRRAVGRGGRYATDAVRLGRPVRESPDPAVGPPILRSLTNAVKATDGVPRAFAF